MKELEKIYQEKKSTGESSDESPANLNPVYFTDVNLQALFQIYDRNNKGFISLDDYFSGKVVYMKKKFGPIPYL